MLTPEQHAIRRNGIGSSDIAALAGVSKYRNAINVFLEKKLPIEEAPIAATGRSPAKWGQRLERLVVQEWAEINEIKSYDDKPGTIHHPVVKIALATPDAWSLTPAGQPACLCEAKAPGLRMAEDWGDNGAPDEYIVQTQWQMGVTGVFRADLCALIGGQDFRMRAIEYDPDLFGNLVEIAERFWTDFVLKDRVPPLDHSDAASEYLRRKFPNAGKTRLQLEGGQLLYAQALAQEMKTMGASEKAAKEARESARNRLAEVCGESAGIEGVCSRKLVEKDSYTVKAQSYVEIRLDREKKK